MVRSYLDSSNWSGRGRRPRWLELLAISGAILTAPSMTRLGTMSCRLASMEERLTELAGRLTLLMEHLAGDALARRVDRADLVQETLLRLLRSGATEQAADEGDSALWAHARTMARRVVVDAARKARFEPRRLSSLVPRRRTQPGTADSTSGPVHAAAGRPGPATEAAVRESAQRWVAAYRRLAPDHRRVIGLRRFEGLSAAETAERMNLSPAAVHSLFRRALGAWDRLADA